jgi:hypothetical protein
MYMSVKFPSGISTVSISISPATPVNAANPVLAVFIILKEPVLHGGYFPPQKPVVVFI